MTVSGRPGKCRRDCARGASQTIFPIDEFWQAAVDRGFSPEAVFLVPENDLDKHYAYVLLTPNPERRIRPRRLS